MRRRSWNITLGLVGTLLEIAPAGAEPPTAHEIMSRAHARTEGAHSTRELHMLLVDARGNKRQRVLRSLSREVGEDSQSLLFFLSPDCPVCKTLLPIVRSASGAEHDWLDVVLASDDQGHEAFIAEHALESFAYVVSPDLGMLYGVGKLPYAALVDENGRIAAFGLVNSREHIESLLFVGVDGIQLSACIDITTQTVDALEQQERSRAHLSPQSASWRKKGLQLIFVAELCLSWTP